ncbi:MAG: efflux RND transporter permease subunit, partial [Muribaculaceae bacterium]|nr:efflux RND transporter permease subunit [Muribaculaceae bacterium]
MKSRSFSIIVIFIALAMLGCALIPRLPVKLMPSRTLPRLGVSFSMPNASARVVESEVTSKLESMLARISGVKEIYSSSSNGYGYINLGFDRNTDMQQARFEASAIIRQAWSQLPAGVSYPAISPAHTVKQSSRPILSYVINAPGEASAIMQYAEENIRPALGVIPGVNRVTLSGATPKEWRLTYDSDLLRTHGLTPADIAAAIAEQTSSKFFGTAMTGGGEWLAVRSVMENREEFDIAKIYVTTPDSVMLRLSQLVTASHVDAKPTGYYRVNGLNSIYCNIYADEDANQLEVAAAVKETVANLSLPAGYSLTLSSDVTEDIASELNKIYFRTGLTLLILLVFVALITLNLRYMAVITVSLLLSLCVSVIFYNLAGIEIQLYSLAGITISLNLIIDNLIVVSDHYRRKRDLSVFTSVLAATLTTIGALSIVFFLETELRLNLQDFVAVVIINLAVSLASAYWLVTSLLDRIGVEAKVRKRRVRRLRAIARFNRIYGAY